MVYLRVAVQLHSIHTRPEPLRTFPIVVPSSWSWMQKMIEENAAKNSRGEVAQTLAMLWLASVFFLVFLPPVICGFDCKTERCQLYIAGFSYWFPPIRFAVDLSLTVVAVSAGFILLIFRQWKYVVLGWLLCCPSLFGKSLFLEELSNCVGLVLYTFAGQANP